MKRKGFSTVEALLSAAIISGVFVIAAAGHLKLSKAFISDRNSYEQTVSEDKVLTRMFKEIKSATAVKAEESALKIENGADMITYENFNGELYRNGNLILSEDFCFLKSNGFIEIQTDNLKVKLR